MFKKASKLVPQGYIERIDLKGIFGWSANPDGTSYADSIHLKIGDASFDLSTTLYRGDLEGLGLCDNACGFAFYFSDIPDAEVSQIFSSGSFEISCKSNVTGFNLPFLLNQIDFSEPQKALAFRMSEIEIAPRGSLDLVDRGLVKGWCFVRGGESIAKVRLRVDGNVVSSTECSIPRDDVLRHFGVLLSGFELPIPLAFYDGRQHVITVEEVSAGLAVGSPRIFVESFPQAIASQLQVADELRTFLAQGKQLLERIELAPVTSVSIDSGWHELFMGQYRTKFDEIREQKSLQQRLSFRPKFSVVCPIYNTDLTQLREAIESVIEQSYDNWELILSDDNSSDGGIALLIETYKARYPSKIITLRSRMNAGISVNTNRAIDVVSGDYVVFFDHDDVLEPDALYAFASVQQERSYKLLYTDEDSIGPDGKLCFPHFKPSWDPILLSGINYICHLVCIRVDLLATVGPLDPSFDGAQDKEFLLRVARYVAGEDVLHIPRVLYHWRLHAASISKDPAKIDKILDNSMRASSEWAEELFGESIVSIAEPKALFGTVVHPILATKPLVSVIIPTRERWELLLPCIKSLMDDGYEALEILVIDHESRENTTLQMLDLVRRLPHCKVIDYKGAFNWSAINNFAAKHATGDLLLFLNNDTELLTKNGISDLVGYAQMKGAGVVGAKMFYENGRIQHAGVVIGPGGIAGHGFVGLPRDDLGYFGYLAFPRSVSAVTGACMMVAASTFKEVGGFDLDAMRVALSDIDLCLKVQKTGRRNVLVSSVEWLHHESVSRGSDSTGEKARRFARESLAFRGLHADLISADPFYNPAFEPHSDPYKYLRVGTGPRYDARQMA